MRANFAAKNITCQNLIGGFQPGLGVGNIYFVMQTGQTFYKQFEADFQYKYSDGSNRVHNTMASAATATVADRNDYIIVFPDSDDYDITTTLTLSKKAVHLIAPGGITDEPGATNATRVDQTGAYAGITISGQAVEVAGIFLKCYADKTGIEISGNAHCCYIHNNFIAMKTTSGSATAYGIHGTSESTNLIIAKNFVNVYSPTAGQTVGGGIVLDNGTRALIKNNIVCPGGFTQTMTVGISAGSGAQSMVIDNDLFEALNNSGSTFTSAITVATNGYAAGNRVAMTTVANSITGGTADKTAVLNYESTNGGVLQDVD